MTKSQAKEVIDMMFKDKTDIPKEDVFKVIDMIDESVAIYPYCPSTPTCPKTWEERIVYSSNSQPKVTLDN